MTLTVEQLDAFCGGTPKERRMCLYCRRTVGPYYSAALANEAMREHFAWIHFASEARPAAALDEPAKRARSYKRR